MKRKRHVQRALSVVQRFFPEVETVQDAEKDDVIEVTKRDSNSATVKNHKACAMAVACKRKFNADGMIISIGTAYVVRGRVATRYRLPESVSREVVSFDRNGGFSPGDYIMKAPSESQRLNVTHGERTGTKNPRKPGRFRHFTEGIRTTLNASEVS